MASVQIGGGDYNVGLAYLNEAARQRQLALQEAEFNARRNQFGGGGTITGLVNQQGLPLNFSGAGQGIESHRASKGGLLSDFSSPNYEIGNPNYVQPPPSGVQQAAMQQRQASLQNAWKDATQGISPIGRQFPTTFGESVGSQPTFQQIQQLEGVAGQAQQEQFNNKMKQESLNEAQARRTQQDENAQLNRQIRQQSLEEQQTRHKEVANNSEIQRQTMPIRKELANLYSQRDFATRQGEHEEVLNLSQQINDKEAQMESIASTVRNPAQQPLPTTGIPEATARQAAIEEGAPKMSPDELAAETQAPAAEAPLSMAQRVRTKEEKKIQQKNQTAEATRLFNDLKIKAKALGDLGNDAAATRADVLANAYAKAATTGIMPEYDSSIDEELRQAQALKSQELKKYKATNQANMELDKEQKLTTEAFSKSLNQYEADIKKRAKKLDWTEEEVQAALDIHPRNQIQKSLEEGLPNLDPKKRIQSIDAQIDRLNGQVPKEYAKKFKDYLKAGAPETADPIMRELVGYAERADVKTVDASGFARPQEAIMAEQATYALREMDKKIQAEVNKQLQPADKRSLINWLQDQKKVKPTNKPVRKEGIGTTILMNAVQEQAPPEEVAPEDQTTDQKLIAAQSRWGQYEKDAANAVAAEAMRNNQPIEQVKELGLAAGLQAEDELLKGKAQAGRAEMKKFEAGDLRKFLTKYRTGRIKRGETPTPEMEFGGNKYGLSQFEQPTPEEANLYYSKFIPAVGPAPGSAPIVLAQGAVKGLLPKINPLNWQWGKKELFNAGRSFVPAAEAEAIPAAEAAAEMGARARGFTLPNYAAPSAAENLTGAEVRAAIQQRAQQEAMRQAAEMEARQNIIAGTPLKYPLATLPPARPVAGLLPQAQKEMMYRLAGLGVP